MAFDIADRDGKEPGNLLQALKIGTNIIVYALTN
jgi:hypothetical protein